LSAIYYIPLLEDADFFIHQARGLPSVTSTKPLRDRFVRACILFSWIALEEVVEHALEKEGLAGAAPAKPFRSRLDFALVAVGRPPVDDRLFSDTRKLRNRFTHPVGGGKLTTASLEDARMVFDFCAGAIRSLLRYEIRWHLDGSLGPRTLREKLRLAADRRRDRD